MRPVAWTTTTHADRLRAERCAGCGHQHWYHAPRGCWIRVNPTASGAPTRECGCREFTRTEVRPS